MISEIKNGDIKLNLENGVKLNSNFNSNINLNSDKIDKFNELLKKLNLVGKIKVIKWKFLITIFRLILTKLTK